MKNKGFTLIELLAVIVILAIIALIATPIILNIIDNTKEEGVKRSIDHYMSAATTAIARKNLNNTSASFNPSACEILAQGTKLDCDGTVSGEIDGTEIDVKVDGTKPTSGTITFENGKITGFTDINIDGNTCNLQDGEIVCSGSEVIPNPDPNPGDGESGTLYTGTIYRNSKEILYIGDSLDSDKRWCAVNEDYNSCIVNEWWEYYIFKTEEECKSQIAANESTALEGTHCEKGQLTYTDSHLNFTETAYLKHDVVDDIVIASYLCVTYEDEGIRNDVCLEGYYSEDDTILSEKYETNISKLKALENYVIKFKLTKTSTKPGSCTQATTSYYCKCYNDSDFLLKTYKRGYAEAKINGSECNIDLDDNIHTYCGE